MAGMQRYDRRALAWLLWLVIFAGVRPAWAAPQAQATLDRQVIAPGEAATLTIIITNEDAHPVLPQVPGLNITLTGQRVSSQYFGGGNSQVTFARTYSVSAGHEGDFSIAPISVNNVPLPPLHLKVSATAAATARAQSGGQAGGQGAAADDKRALPFMRVVLPHTRLYVGEEVPIQIKAYFREGTEAHMEGPLAVTGDAFTATGLDTHPVRSEEVINGENWVVLTWPCVLGAIKSGNYPLNIELPLLVRLRLGGDADMQRQLQALFGMAHTNGFIGDDLDEVFGRQVERHLVLKPPATQVQVLSVPAAGRPADFTGAVGHFEVAATVAPTGGAVGEPLTFRITVSGRGNLSRFSTPGLADSAQWRVYRPEAQQVSASATGGVGSRTFSQPIVPRVPGALRVPGIALSWFDPDTERYETRQTPALTVMVSPAPGADTRPASGLASAPAMSSAPAAVPVAAPLRPVSGWRHTHSLRPLVRAPWFLALLAAPVAGLLLILLWRGVGGFIGRARPDQGAGAQAARRWLASLDAAITREDAAEFLAVARRALQGCSTADPALAQEILAAADQVAYGAGSMSGAQLRHWRERMAALLAGGGS